MAVDPSAMPMKIDEYEYPKGRQVRHEVEGT
jgi:hypothetical protein